LAAALVALTLAVYAPAFRASFVNFDDPQYVARNPHLAAGLTRETVVWAFTTGAQGNWHPLTWMSHALDRAAFGGRAAGHHATSVAIHAANTVLLFVFFAAATGATNRSAAVAALFAVHPLHVESVAWVSERKDVLSTLFGLLAMLAYLRWARAPSRRGMAVVALLFAAGLASKPMLVTLPFVLLLLDAWPLVRVDLSKATWREFRPLVRQKLLLFALAAASSVVTLLAQRAANATSMNAQIALPWRIGNAAVSYAIYLAQTVVPQHLAIFYPHPGTKLSIPLAAACGAALAGASAGAWRLRTSRPYVLFGWLWFLGTLIPVIGIVQVGAQAHADRYTYIPLIGIFVTAVWGCADLVDAIVGNVRPSASSSPDAWSRLAPVMAVLPPLAFTAWMQVGTWRDGIVLWRHAIEVTAPSAPAHAMLGVALAESKRNDEAEKEFEEALRLDSTNWYAANGLGTIRMAQGRSAEALALFEKAIASRSRFTEAYANAAAALDALGRPAEALARALTAVAIDPEFADGQLNAGMLLAHAGRSAEAVRYLEVAHRLAPGDVKTLNNLGLALVDSGRAAEGIARYRAALALNPDNPQVLCNLGGALTLTGRLDEAESLLHRALALVPNYGIAHSNLAAAAYLAGRHADAWEEIHAARAAGIEPPAKLLESLRARMPERP
jgi:tetratricopeptide (TPR) repeat protein